MPSRPESSEPDAGTPYYALVGPTDDDSDSDYVPHAEDGDTDDDDRFHEALDRFLEAAANTDGGDEEDNEEEPELEYAEDEAEAAANEVTEEMQAVRQRLLSLMNAGRQPALLTHTQLMALLRGTDLNEILMEGVDDEDDEYDEWERTRRSRRRGRDPNRFPKVPSDKGRELMDSGVFGHPTARDDPERLQQTRRKAVARRVLDRELGLGDQAFRRLNQALIAQSMIPSGKADMVMQFDSPVYSGQFSDDGNFYFAVGKDFKVRMYDTSNPHVWQHYKTVQYPFGQWTLTDASLSPDNRWLAYSSIQDKVCLAPTNPSDTGDPYTLDLSGGQNVPQALHIHGWGARRAFGIWSVRFSGDGRELVAGTNVRSIVVFDIESRQVLHHVQGHDNDVNAVCFADKGSPHILYSGSDDATIKVWDRRSLGDGREAGAFVGHVEGLTYIDSKGDGRYILSNGKDQTMKLWDLRMAYSSDRFRELDLTHYTPSSDFDYRWSEFTEDDWLPHPNDNSLVTFRGHEVLRTLIRCHFSPPGSSDSRYVYSASSDGAVYVWNLDATLAAKIDVAQATYECVQAAGGRNYRLHGLGYRGWSSIVRDASWHPHAPLLAASSWNGFDQGTGAVSLHSWNNAGEADDWEPAMGQIYTERMERMERKGRMAVRQYW